jgi:hypothetical protein
MHILFAVSQLFKRMPYYQQKFCGPGPYDDTHFIHNPNLFIVYGVLTQEK